MIRVNVPSERCDCAKCGKVGTKGKFLPNQPGGRGRIDWYCLDCGLPKVRVIVHGRRVGKRAGYRR